MTSPALSGSRMDRAISGSVRRRHARAYLLPCGQPTTWEPGQRGSRRSHESVGSPCNCTGRGALDRVRARVGRKPHEVLGAIQADPRIQVYPLTAEIVIAAQDLSAIGEMHDRQIVATTMHLTVDGEAPTLLTKDADIVMSAQVPTLW